MTGLELIYANDGETAPGEVTGGGGSHSAKSKYRNIMNVSHHRSSHCPRARVAVSE